MPAEGARLRKAEWSVRDAELQFAQRLVRRDHYSRGSSNTATYVHGLFPVGAAGMWHESCRGIAWWIPPTKTAGQSLAGDGWGGVLALSRLVIEADVPRNGCSFLLARSMKLIDRACWPVLVTYADKWRGHTGAIYLAAGWTLDGETSPESTYTLNGRMLGRKHGPTTRTHAEMLAMGCVLEGRFSRIRFVHRSSLDDHRAAGAI